MPKNTYEMATSRIYLLQKRLESFVGPPRLVLFDYFVGLGSLSYFL